MTMTLRILLLLLLCSAATSAPAQSEAEKVDPPAPSEDAEKKPSPQDAPPVEESPAGGGSAGSGSAGDGAAGDGSGAGITDDFDPLDAELEALGAEELGAMDQITALTRDIADNMKQIEELLDRKDTGASTQAIQTRTVEQIDELIELIEQSSSSSGGGGEGGGQQRGSSTQEQDQRRGGKNRQVGGAQQQREQQRRLEELERQRREEEGRNEPQDSPGDTRNDGTRDLEMPPEDEGSPDGAADERGRWGRLPRTEIEKMYDKGRRQLPDKYRILLEEYFRRLPTGD